MNAGGLMSKRLLLSHKNNISRFLSKKRLAILGTILVLAAIVAVVFSFSKNDTTSMEIDNITDIAIEEGTEGDIAQDETVASDEHVVSNEQIIYIAPEDLYVDENVVISVTSHVYSQLYGQGIRFEYRNKSLNEVEIAIKPAEDSGIQESNITIIEPGTTQSHVLYIGLDAEPFTEGAYMFTITSGDDRYSTETISIKAK
jgi:hypothetical protein